VRDCVCVSQTKTTPYHFLLFFFSSFVPLHERMDYGETIAFLINVIGYSCHLLCVEHKQTNIENTRCERFAMHIRVSFFFLIHYTSEWNMEKPRLFK
jgi:hypothetical protein